MFSFIFYDESSEINVVCFGEKCKFHEILIVGQRYEIRYGKVEIADEQYNQTHNRFEIHLDGNSRVIPLNETIEINEREVVKSHTTATETIKVDLGHTLIKDLVPESGTWTIAGVVKSKTDIRLVKKVSSMIFYQI